MADKICSLCGESFLDNPVNEEDQCTGEHAVAKQFYPESIRPQLRKELWKVPSHKKCNASYKLDEEYFYHRFYPLVRFQNEATGQLVFGDIARRAKKPQTPAILRHMAQECSTVTPGGIVLPESVWVGLDEVRVQRVVVKIAQCLFYKDHSRFLPRANCEHIERCIEVSQLQEHFLALCMTPKQTIDERVFSYWHKMEDGDHYYSLLFWDAFMYCLMFRDPPIS